MSVLSFPRIYFKGYAGWNPCTFNNNDWQKFPTYDAANAALNWAFLANEKPPVTQENFLTTFRPYAITLQPDDLPPDAPRGPRVPCEWNMFGSHAVAFVQYNDYTTTITGGDIGYNQPATGDPLIGATLSIAGDNQYSAPKLVDINPMSFWSSQVYYSSFTAGSGNYSVSGPRAVRMHSRWINLSRIYNSTGKLTQPAASVACCFQACIPNTGIVWQNGSGGPPSPLLAALQQASTQPGAQGVMVRFTAYVNLYFQNGIFNNFAQQPRTYEELAAYLRTAWDTWNSSGKTTDFFSQPCYSHIVGSVGVWNEGELASAPLGRYLSPQSYSVTPVGGTNSTQLGPVAAQVDYQTNILSLDLGSAIPELAEPGTSTSNLTKTDFGTLTVGVQTGSGFLAIGQLDYSQYNKTAYEASAGIVDLPIPASISPTQLQQGLLTIQAGGNTALGETAFSAQTDSRGIYLDQGGQQQFQITVLQQGAPAAGALVLVAQYDQNLNLVPITQTPYIGFTLGDQQTINVGSIQTNVTIVTADANGIATAGVSAGVPGFPVVAFFPFSGTTLPTPPASLLPPTTPAGPGPMFYATIRVLPFDNGVPEQFIELWNATHNPALAWNFVYERILYLYDMLFSVMLEFVNLGSQASVQSNATGIASAIAPALAAEGTGAMPVTRDLSQGKRVTLQLYLYLLSNNFNVPVLSLESVTNS